MPSRARATVGIMMNSFIAAMDVMAVGPAMPTIVAELGNVKLLFLVFSVYLVASTVTVPIWGRLSDIYGRLVTLITGIGIFLVGSALCGFAGTIEVLILFRSLQGIGAGAILTLGFTMMADMYPIQKRAKMQGLLASMWGVASIVGPMIGGVITETWSWRGVFYINIPIGLTAIALIYFSWAWEPKQKKKQKLDILGGAVFTLSMALILMSLAFISRRVLEWNDPRALAMMISALIGTVMTVVIERRHPAPFLHFELFRNRIFVAVSAIGFFATQCLFAISAYGPLYVQGVLGENPMMAGFALTPMAIGWVTFSSISGFLLLKFGLRILTIVGTLILITGYVFLGMLEPGVSWWRVALNYGVVGCGMGWMMAPMVMMVQHSVAKEMIGAATGFTQFLRTMGGALGLALMGVLFAGHLAPLESQIGMTAEEAVRLNNTGLDPDTLRALQAALSGSIRNVFRVGLGAAILAFCMTFVFPKMAPLEKR